jgi:putative glutamine amidotransferase
MRPVIAVTAWRRDLDTFLGKESLQTLSTFYTDALIDAGMTPIVFPNGQDPDEAQRLVDMVDGVLISGGDDVDPESYGAGNDGSRGYSKAVDDFEIAVVTAARAQDKPVLAICRGLQLLNVALGGTLAQDVLVSGTAHELINKDTDRVELNARRHVVQLEPESVLAGLYQSSEAKVNTLHHQGIKRLAPELLVEARTDDGLIEAARCDGAWWALGVQWHPERMEGEHRELFHAFREAISG